MLPDGNTRGSLCAIVNGGAHCAGAPVDYDRLEELLGQHGAKASVLVATEGSQIQGLCEQALSGGAEVLIACGGDGTINAVAKICLERQALLGVIPMGTLNHFAKDLAIPLELTEAVVNVLTGPELCVDVGEVNGKLFLNNSSVGLYPQIVQERERGQRRGDSKWWAFAKAAAAIFRRYPVLNVVLKGVKGDDVTTQTPFVFVGNNQYEVGGLRIGSRSRLDEGSLWVYHPSRATRGDLVRIAISALLGSDRVRELEVSAVSACSITPAGTSVLVSTDGEVQALSPPLNYRILPKALRVIAPGQKSSGGT